MMQTQTVGNFLALDIGEKRIGLATAHTVARLPHPLVTLANDAAFLEALQAVIKQESVIGLIVGLPRNLSGEDTDQTRYVREFAAQLRSVTDLPISFQDEALTSRKAEDELRSRGGIKDKGDVDSLAAMFILEDYLNGVS